jgi:hypothetical protein
MQILARAINEVVWRCVGNSHGSIGLNSLQEPRAPPGMLSGGGLKREKERSRGGSDNGYGTWNEKRPMSKVLVFITNDENAVYIAIVRYENES